MHRAAGQVFSCVCGRSDLAAREPPRAARVDKIIKKEPVPTGPDIIRGYVAKLTDSPGVYRMLGADGAVLYVGKARSLRKRVASYTRYTGHPVRIARMISATASMEFVTTATETDALLLEANLIKQLKPRFDVLLRDDIGRAHV